MDDVYSVSGDVSTNKRRKKLPVSKIALRFQTTKLIAKEWIREISKRSTNDVVYQFAAEHTPSPFLIGCFTIKQCTETNAVVLSTPLQYWSNTPTTHAFPIKYRCSSCTNIIETGTVTIFFNPIFTLPYIVICSAC